MELFASVDEFLAFKRAWHNAVTSPNAKPSYAKQDEFQYNIPADAILDKGWIRQSPTTIVRKDSLVTQETGWIYAEHFLMYNMLVARPYCTGFNPSKHARGGACAWWSFFVAVRALRNRIRTSELIISIEDSSTETATLKEKCKLVEKAYPNWKTRRYLLNLVSFLKPFDDTIINYQLLAKLDKNMLQLILDLDSTTLPNFIF